MAWNMGCKNNNQKTYTSSSENVCQGLDSYLVLHFPKLQSSDFFFFICCRTLSAKNNTHLKELRHPNILQFLGSIVHDGEMTLITEYLSKVKLISVFSKDGPWGLLSSDASFSVFLLLILWIREI